MGQERPRSRRTRGFGIRRLEGVAASRIHLVRHGEVENPERVLYGRLEGYGLSELGQRMAQAAADEIAASGRPVSALFASPLQRTQESAAPIALAFDLTPRLDERFIEPANDFEGMRMTGPRRRTPPPAQLGEAAQPAEAQLGRAVRVHRRTHDGRHRRRGCLRRRRRRRHREPPAAHLDGRTARSPASGSRTTRASVAASSPPSRASRSATDVYVEVGYSDPAAARCTPNATDVGAV